MAGDSAVNMDPKLDTFCFIADDTGKLFKMDQIQVKVAYVSDLQASYLFS